MKTTSFHRGLLFLAGLLLSLHSLVPHVHGGPWLGEQETSVSNIPRPDGGIFSLLQGLFSDSDLGEDHLEHFAADHDVTLDLELVVTLPPAVFPTPILVSRTTSPVVRRQRVFRNRHFPPSGVYPDVASPRGPPSFA